MNKLVKVPSKFDPYLANFSDLFTKPSFVSFCYLTASIAVCDKSKTIFNLHDTMAKETGIGRLDLLTTGSSQMAIGTKTK